MEINAINSIRYAEMIIPSVYSSMLNMPRRINDEESEKLERKIEPINATPGEDIDMLNYRIGDFLDVKV